jgi:hypothetical protein
VSPPGFSVSRFLRTFSDLKTPVGVSVAFVQVSPRGILPCTCFYDHAHRLRLEKLLCIEVSRSSNRFLKSFLDPGGGFTSETAKRRFQN